MMVDDAFQERYWRNWFYILLRATPAAILTVAGAFSLARGVWGMFDLKQAIFGANLLVAASLVELFVWFVKRRSVEREMERAYALRWQALQKCDEVLRVLQAPQNKSIIEVMRLLEGPKKPEDQKPGAVE